MASGIEANGNFEIKTDRGQIRVHPGNVIGERSDAVWVCEKEEADTLIKHLELHQTPPEATAFLSAGSTSSPNHPFLASQI